MLLNNQKHPTKDQFRQMVASFPKNTPVTMVNILRFNKSVDGSGESGEEAYARYGKNVLPFMKSVGAKLLWRGRLNSTLIGDSEGSPQLILLVEYPTIDHFIKMTSDPQYVKISEDRTVALEYGGLWACQEEYSLLK